MILRLILFLIINFAALGIGSFFTDDGSSSGWYASLNKAPWNPPGWAFGFAWTTIMICFSIFMTLLWPRTRSKSLLLTLFIIQWILNVAWNPVFFYYHQVLAGLIVICMLTVVVGYFLFAYRDEMKWKSLWVLPYFAWLLVATSLNGYIWLNN